MMILQKKWLKPSFKRVSFLFAFFSLPLFADSRIEVFRNLGKGNQKAITYPATGCRFGDNLLAYLNARWLSYKYNLPFLYRQFPYSDQLALHEKDYLRLDLHWPFFKKFWALQQEQDILKISGPALITVPYFPL